MPRVPGGETSPLTVAGLWALLSPWQGTMVASGQAGAQGTGEGHSNVLRSPRGLSLQQPGSREGMPGSAECLACLVWDKD